MARYGARHIRWAPITAESAGTKPTYGNAIALGKLQKVTDSPAFSEAKQYGDDALAEFVNEFKEIGVDIEITDISQAVYVAVFDAKKEADNNGLSFTTEDTPPYGGLAFTCCKQVNNVKSYFGVFYPKLKATMQGEEFTTKGDNVTLAGGKLKFTGTEDNRKRWREFSEEFQTVAEAEEWVDSVFGATQQPAA